MKKSQMVIKILLVGLILFLLIRFTEQYSNNPPVTQSSSIVDEFTLNKIVAEDYSLAKFNLSFPQEKKILLNFWASWCKSCERERSYLNQLVQDENHKLMVLSIASFDKLSDIKSSKKMLKMKSTILLDEKGEIATKLGVVEYPQSFLLDEKGKVLKIFIGPLNPESTRIISSLL